MILTVTANAAIDKRYVVERFGVGQVNRVKSCTANAGGKGINVARVAEGSKVILSGAKERAAPASISGTK